MHTCDHCGIPIIGAGVAGVEGGDGAAFAYCCYGCRMAAEVLGHQAERPAYGGRTPEETKLLYRFFGGTLLAGFVMVISLAISSEYGFDTLRQLNHDVGVAHGVLLAAAVPALLLLGPPVARGAWCDLRLGHLTLNVLFALGTASAVGVSLASYVRGSGPVYLETATMLLALYTLGRYLDARARGETTRVLSRLLDVPDTTYRRLAPDEAEVPPEALAVGNLVQLRAGDVMPIDGVIEHGRSFVDEHRLTGEAQPTAKVQGDTVFAGTTNLDGLLHVRVTATAGDRRLARVEALVREALARPPRVAALADRIMRWFIPSVVVLSLVTFVAWWIVAGFDRALYAALSVTLIACPCALGLAIPLALVVSLGQAARRGILVRSGQALLDLGRANEVLLDKTGTLTDVHTQALRLVVPRNEAVLAGENATDPPLPRADHDTLLACAAAIEQSVQHPLADAVLRAADARKLSLPPARDARIVPGAGVVGRVVENDRERDVALGSRELMDELGIDVTGAWQRSARAFEEDGARLTYLTVDGEPAALIVVEEAPLPDAHAAVDALVASGCRVRVLTGDRAAAGRRLQQHLGLDVESECSPTDKQQTVRERRASGTTVAFVGDGINDAAALAEADVGIALASGAGLAVEAADVTLYNSDLNGVAWLRALGRRTRRIIRQNLTWTLLYNVAGLGLAVAGLLHPLAAVGLMVFSSILVTWNALRLRSDSSHLLP